MPLMGNSQSQGSGALSAQRRLWQSPADDASRRAMRFLLILAAVLLTALPAAPSRAVPGGEIGTLPHGRYFCELPGDAAGPWRIRVPEEDFVVISASNYQANGGRGSYLITNDNVAMTSGPLNGNRYIRQSHGFLRLIGDDRLPGKLRCVLSTRNND
jgi:hypothetical protein